MEAGLDSMSEETRATYIPQFVSEAQQRLGDALLVRLSPEGRDQLVKVMQTEDMTPETLRAFWVSHIPNFDAEVTAILTGFGNELKDILSKTA